MSHKTYTLILVLLFGMFLTSCVKPFTEKDNGTTINLGIDDPFEIELEGNPTTGYIWEVASFEASIIKQIGEARFEPDDGKPGSGGKYTFEFQTIAAGQTSLTLIYHRKFEENEPPTFTMEIVAGTMGRILED